MNQTIKIAILDLKGNIKYITLESKSIKAINKLPNGNCLIITDSCTFESVSNYDEIANNYGKA